MLLDHGIIKIWFNSIMIGNKLRPEIVSKLSRHSIDHNRIIMLHQEIWNWILIKYLMEEQLLLSI